MRLLPLLLLAACTQEPAPDARAITLTLAADTAAVAKACGDAGILEDFGCAYIGATSCRIVALRPRGFDDDARIKTLGHELWHCFHGAVHD